MTITATGRIAAIAAAAILTIGMPVAAFADPGPAPTPAPAQAQDQQAAKAKRTLYCVVDRFTGTRVAHKVCKTREDWIKNDGYDPTK